MSRAVDLAYKRVREGIISGRFAPGERLKESVLVKYCGVSRTPVRSALSRLAAEDFVELSSNQGARVRSLDRRELDDMFSLRALLEGFAAARAAQRINAKQLARMEAALKAYEAQAKRPGIDEEARIEAFLKSNSKVHGIVWEASGSDLLPAMLRRLVDRALQVHTARFFTAERMAESHRHHTELLRALKAGDARRAETVMSGHIQAAREVLQSAVED